MAQIRRSWRALVVIAPNGAVVGRII